MSNMSNMSENGNIDFDSIIPLAGGWAWAAEQMEAELYTQAFYQEFSGLIKEYPFVKYVKRSAQEKFFKSFGPNWAYHMVSAIKARWPEIYAWDIAQTHCKDDPHKNIKAHSDCDTCTPEEHNQYAGVFLSGYADMLCEGLLIENSYTLASFYCWRPDIRVRHMLKKHPSMTEEYAMELVYEFPSISLPFEEKVSLWKTEVEKMLAVPSFGKVPCPDCSGPPMYPLTLAIIGPLMKRRNVEIYPTPSPCCSNERCAFILI